MTEGMPRPDKYSVDRDILPIFVVTSPGAGQKLVSFQGTRFLIGKQVFVTCWHCVDTPLPNDRFYAVLVKAGQGFTYRAAALMEPEQDRNGTDLATARVNLEPESGLTLADSDAPGLVDVWSFGYPFTTLTEEIPEVGRLPLIQARALKGTSCAASTISRQLANSSAPTNSICPRPPVSAVAQWSGFIR